MEKPITLTIEETKQSIAQVLNEAKLHPYIMDSIMKDLYNEVHALYIRTVQNEKAEYEKKMASQDEVTIETIE